MVVAKDWGVEIDQVRMCIIVCLFIIAGAYSIYGGLASVAWTDVLQVVFLVGGGLITAYAALYVIGAEVWGCGPLEALGNIYSWCIGQEGDKHFNLVVTRNEDLYPVINGVKDATGAVLQKSDPYFDSPGIVLIFGALWLTNIGFGFIFILHLCPGPAFSFVRLLVIIIFVILAFAATTLFAA